MQIDNSPGVDPEFRSSDRVMDQWDSSEAARILKQLQANPRIKYISIAVPADACPVCKNIAGTYHKDQVPRLPIDLCSHPLGCRANYVPSLEDIFP